MSQGSEAHRDEVGALAPAPGNTSEPRLTFDEVAEYLKRLEETERSAFEHYDEVLLALSGGAIGASLVLLERLQDQQLEAFVALFIAWVFWVLSLGLLLFDLAAGKLAVRKARRDAETIQRHPESREAAEAQAALMKGAGDPWKTRGDVASLAAGAAFVFGLVAVLWFATVNLLR